MNFREYLERKGLSYDDFGKPKDLDDLINEYAIQYLAMYYGV